MNFVATIEGRGDRRNRKVIITRHPRRCTAEARLLVNGRIHRRLGVVGSDRDIEADVDKRVALRKRQVANVAVAILRWTGTADLTASGRIAYASDLWEAWSLIETQIYGHPYVAWGDCEARRNESN